MKKIVFLVVAILALSGFANAAITVALSGSPVAVAGGFQYNYTESVDALEQLAPGNYATCNPGPVACGTFFTIYDFAGYVAGSVMSPANWGANVQLTGITPVNQLPTDSGVITNLTFNFTGGATVPGPLGPTGGFSAVSIYSTVNTGGQFTYQAQKLTGTADQGIGILTVPLATTGVPEPSSMILIGVGLIGLAVLRKKFVS